MDQWWPVFVRVDLVPLSAGVLAAMTCALLGNFLVLRRQSLMGDAISHSVLPGLVIAFLVAGSRNPGAMFLGAATAGIATAVLVELVRTLGRVEPGAAMGVVFSVLFALGVLLIQQAAAENVDLDAGCVLYGQLEMLFWEPPAGAAVFSPEALATIPRQLWTLCGVFVLTVLFNGVFYKEMRVVCFDPAYATSQGIGAGLMHHALMVLVAAATVASFEAVGSILVIAMLICPPAAARLLTDRYWVQIAVSAVLAAASGVLGYWGATGLPGLFGHAGVNAAGGIAVASGVLLTAAVFAAPRHGLLPRLLRRRRLGRDVVIEDLVASLYRLGERGVRSIPRDRLPRALGRGEWDSASALAGKRGLIVSDGRTIRLSPAGQAFGRDLVRRHRLWESFLVSEAGLAVDHVHETAEHLEHLPIEPDRGPDIDPHGRVIPGQETE